MAAQPVTFATHHVIRWNGEKYEWKFGDDDVDAVGSERVVKLHPKSSSLLAFIIQDQQVLKAWRGEHKGKGPSALEGYRQMMRFRNEAQAAELVVSAPASKCTLFGGAQSQVPPARRDRKKKASPESSLLSIPIEVSESGGDTTTVHVKVKRPITSRDALCIEFTQSTVVSVIRFIRQAGMIATAVYEERNKATPKGVWKRKSSKGEIQFLAMNPSKKYRLVSSIDDALVAQNECSDSETADQESTDVEQCDDSNDADECGAHDDADQN